MTIWNSNTHKGFTPPSQGIWQWLVLNNTKPTHFKGESEYWHARSTFYYQANQISFPNQWWRSIHHQLNDQGLETCDDQKTFNHHMIGKGMFSIAANTIGNRMISIAKLTTTKSIPSPIVWELIFFPLSHDWWPKIFGHYKLSNEKNSVDVGLVTKNFQLPQALWRLKWFRIRNNLIEHLWTFKNNNLHWNVYLYIYAWMF